MTDMNVKVSDVELMTEKEIKNMSDSMDIIKGYTIYYVPFKNYMGYSAIVFKDDHQIYYVNDYELHHNYKPHTTEELKEIYRTRMQNKLFTEEEIKAPIKDYDEYHRKRYFLHNYYAMSKDYVSMFYINRSTDEDTKREENIKKNFPYLNPVGFCYMNDKAFIKHHVELLNTLMEQLDAKKNDYMYWKKAFIHEMYNHEYAINYYQRNWDTLSAFYDGIEFNDNDDMEVYFKQLNMPAVQQKAYRAARKYVLAHSDF